MRIGCQRPAPAHCPAYQAVPAAPLLTTMESVTNSTRPLTVTPPQQGRLSNVLKWLTGKNAQAEDVERQKLASGEKGAQKISVRAMCENPPPAPDEAGDISGKARFLLGLALFSAGGAAGWLGNAFFTRYNGETCAAPLAQALQAGDAATGLALNCSGAADMNALANASFAPAPFFNDSSLNLYVNDKGLAPPVVECVTTPLNATDAPNNTTLAQAVLSQCGTPIRTFQPKWANLPTNNELRENHYIAQLLHNLDANIIARDLYGLKSISPEKYQRVRVVIDNLSQLIEAAIAGLQSKTNSYLPPRPVNDANSAALTPLQREASGQMYQTRPIEDFANDPADDVHNGLFNRIDTGKQFSQSLLMLMTKSLSSLKRTYPDVGSNYLNFITVDHPQTKTLLATTGNTALMRQSEGFNQPDIILGNDFFTLCLYESMQVLLQQLTFYYTDATELFPMMEERFACDEIASSEAKADARFMIDHVNGWRLQKLAEFAPSLMEGRWESLSPAFSQQELAQIPDFPRNGTSEEQERAFISHYQSSDAFRHLVNTRNADFWSNIILAIGNTQNYIDGLTSPFTEA